MEQNNYKYAQTLNLPTLNIKSQLNISIDSNAYIKQILNIETCLIDVQIEPMQHKALFKGNIGVKVVYIDTDNMLNTISDSVSFSETVTNDNITNDCQISVFNNQFISEYDNDDKMLRINIEGSIDCFCAVNNTLNAFNPIDENIVCKKSVLSASTLVQKINKNVNYDYELKLDYKITKMLSYDSKIIIDETKCFDGYVIVNGQIINTLMYEIENAGLTSIKVYNNSTPFKCEVEAPSCDGDCVADISSYIDLNSTQITTQINENNAQLVFEYSIIMNGYLYKNISMDIIEDLYSLNSVIEPVNNTYLICKKMPYFKVNENVDAEITLADELNVDEIIGMVNSTSSITQYSIKETGIIVEGVISGNLLYFDENREIKNLPTQLPYSINIKQEFNEQICSLHLSIIPTSCKCKIKRGNTLMVDYELCLSGNAYSSSSVQLIDNVKYGKVLDFEDISFQIYIARPNENCWDLCKRLHVSKEKLMESNNDIPSTYMGGEKIIVYR